MARRNQEIVSLTREIQSLCDDLPTGKWLRVYNKLRKIRLAAGGLPPVEDIESIPKKEGESQKAMILEYLQLGHPLTSLEALRHFGCARLGARIWDLKHDKKDPKNIVTEIVHDKKTGKRYASYTLIAEQS